MSNSCEKLSWQLISRAAAAALAIAIVFALAAVSTPSAQAQTYNVIQNFGNYGGVNGANPSAGLTMDRAGNLYGTTYSGGLSGSCDRQGTVFRLSPQGSGWLYSLLYCFSANGADGEYPQAPVTIGPDGALYGITLYGGGTGCEDGCGTVFKVRPPATACNTALCPWPENVLYSFTGGGDGGNPTGNLIFDAAGNIYGTAEDGGANNQGVVFKLTPSGSGWTESVLYSLNGGTDGQFPQGGVIFDKAGNLYGTALSSGPNNYGTAFELMSTGSGWTLTVLRSFIPGSDGAFPIGGLIFDRDGNLYGTTAWAGPNGGGTAFELSPSGASWLSTTLYGFTCYGSFCSDDVDGIPGGSLFSNVSNDHFADSPGPQSSLLMDAAGNLYGTTVNDGPNGCGTVFKLTPSGGNWAYTSLHDFTCGADGGDAYGNLIMDANGNLYGTAYLGGAYGSGVAFEITP